MRTLWLAWLPLLFLPNFGLSGATAFGTLELSDFMIVPYLGLVAIAGKWQPRIFIDQLVPPLLGFAVWSLVSTLLIRERYGYFDHRIVIVGLLKLGKLSLYALAAVLTARALTNRIRRRVFLWSLTASGVIVALALMTVHQSTKALTPDGAQSGYKAENAVSVMMAILLCYLGSVAACRGGSRRWREMALPAMALMIPGFLLSHGRGGWIAALAGACYFLYRRGIGARMMVAFIVLGGVTAATYAFVPAFQEELDRTIWPDQEAMTRYRSGVGGFDDGARISTWTHELGAFWKAPILGTGFFHRGGLSGLWENGSHNFLIQMFLESGLVGGFLIVLICRRMWKAAGTIPARKAGQDIPVRTSLVAAGVGGLTGEYFYGGMVLFTLLAVFAIVGGLEPFDESILDSHEEFETFTITEREAA